MREVSASARCIYSESQVEAALDEMAAAITRNLEDSNPILLSVMNGALIVTAKLATRLHFPLQLDYLHVTRYRGNTCGGDLDWKCYPSLSLQDRAVLVVDDILDEGATLECVVSYCKQGGASEVLRRCLLRSCMNTSSHLLRQILSACRWMTTISMAMGWITKDIFATYRASMP